jgi:dihydroorotase
MTVLEAARGRDRADPAGDVGVLVDLDISGAWLVDPVTGREGPADLVVRDGVLEAVEWLATRRDVDDRGIVVAPGFTDLHAHLREPGDDAAETIASGLAAAAHGGFTAVSAMPNTHPPVASAATVAAALTSAAASGSPVRLLPFGAITADRAGERLGLLGEMADAGAAGFSDDGAPVLHAELLRNALAYAGMLGLPIVDHPEDATMTAGAEANDGLISTVLGLRGWPGAAEATAVVRDIAVLAEVVRDVPSARLHLTHLSTGAALEQVRAAKAIGLPVTCDVTPHHLAMTDEWVAGSRRWAWEALEAEGTARDPWRDGVIEAPPYDSAVRVNPPLRSPIDARACREALLDGTIDAIATDHAPHSAVAKGVEFGLAKPGIAGIETALGVLLTAIDAGELPLRRVVEALTAGPDRVLAGDRGPRGTRSLVEGQSADLVVFDRSARWTVEPEALLTRASGHPLLGRSLPGRVLLTVAGGRLAYEGATTD